MILGLALPYGITLRDFAWFAAIVSIAHVVFLIITRTRYEVALVEAAKEIAVIGAPYLAVAIVSAYLAGVDQGQMIQFLHQVRDNMANVFLAKGACLANIRATPIWSSWYDQAAARMGIYDMIVTTAFYTSITLEYTFYIAHAIAAVAAAIGGAFMARPTRAIGATALAFALVYLYGFALFQLSTVAGLADKIGVVQVSPTSAGLFVTLDNSTIYIAPGSGAAVKCDEAIAGWLQQHAQYYVNFEVAATMFLALVGTFFWAVRSTLTR
mgnify:CR=1 FL=1